MVDDGWSSQRTSAVANYAVGVAPGVQRLVFKYIGAPALVFGAEREAADLSDFRRDEVWTEASNGTVIAATEIHVLKFSGR